MTPEPTLSRSEAVTSRYSCTGSPDAHTRISRNGTSTESSSDQLSSDSVTADSTNPIRGWDRELDRLENDDVTNDKAVVANEFDLKEFTPADNRPPVQTHDPNTIGHSSTASTTV